MCLGERRDNDRAARTWAEGPTCKLSGGTIATRGLPTGERCGARTQGMPDLTDTHLGKRAKCHAKARPKYSVRALVSHSAPVLPSETVRGQSRCNAATSLR